MCHPFLTMFRVCENANIFSIYMKCPASICNAWPGVFLHNGRTAAVLSSWMSVLRWSAHYVYYWRHPATHQTLIVCIFRVGIDHNELYSSYAWAVPELCLSCTRTMPELCPSYAQAMPELCPKLCSSYTLSYSYSYALSYHLNHARYYLASGIAEWS